MLNLAGVGGVVALLLVVFSLLLGVLAISNQSPDTHMLEVIKYWSA